jgi:hypothetical protein
MRVAVIGLFGLLFCALSVLVAVGGSPSAGALLGFCLGVLLGLVEQSWAA